MSGSLYGVTALPCSSASRACYVLWRVNIALQRSDHSAHAGIQATLRIWLPAYAGMTFPLYIHAPGSAFNMHNTL